MVTYNYDIIVDEDNFVVKEYETEKELVDDLATYHFGKVLPVVSSGGVKIKDVTVHDIDILG